MLLDQKILIEFKGDQAQEFLSIWKELRDFMHLQKHTPLDEQYIHGAENIAKFLNKSISTIYNKSGKADFPVKKNGHELVAKRADLIAYIEGRYNIDKK